MIPKFKKLRNLDPEPGEVTFASQQKNLFLFTEPKTASPTILPNQYIADSLVYIPTRGDHSVLVQRYQVGNSLDNGGHRLFLRKLANSCIIRGLLEATSMSYMKWFRDFAPFYFSEEPGTASRMSQAVR